MIKSKRKRKRKILISILTLILIYIILLISTGGFLKDFKNCVLGKSENSNPLNALNRYTISKSIKYDNIDIMIMPIFAIYGLNEGVIIVHYKIHASYEGDLTYYSATVFPLYLATWKLERVDGEWIVVEIDEHP